MDSGTSYTRMDEESNVQSSSYNSSTSSYNPPGESRYERPTTFNINMILMIISIVVMAFFAVVGLLGLIKMNGLGRVIGGGGGDNLTSNVYYLASFIMFTFIPIAAFAILCELRVGFVLSRVPIFNSFFGRAGLYFYCALCSLGAAGDVGIFGGAVLLFNTVLHIVAGVMALQRGSAQ